MSISLKNKLKIREYIPGDYEAIISLWETLDLGRPERGDNKEIIENTIQNGGLLIILENPESNELIGTSWITNDHRRLYLHHFGIKKKYQRKGLSKILLDKSLEFAKSKNMQIKLEVHKTNLPALELYKKNNFNYLGDYEIYIIRTYS